MAHVNDHIRTTYAGKNTEVSVGTSNDERFGRYGVHVMCYAYGEITSVMLTANDARAFARELLRKADGVGASREVPVMRAGFRGMDD